MAALYQEFCVDLMNTYLSVSTHNLNRVMRVLTLVTAIFLPLTLIAGIYGMNFDNIPELHWPYGYFIALGLMATVTGSLVILFKKIKWL